MHDNDNDNIYKCSICLDVIDNNDFILLKCNHYFHLTCTMKHVKYNLSYNKIVKCPLCRNQISRDLFYDRYKECYDLRKNIKKDIIKLQKQIYILYFKFQIKRMIRKANNINTFKYLIKEEELIEMISLKKLILNNVNDKINYLDKCLFYI